MFDAFAEGPEEDMNRDFTTLSYDDVKHHTEKAVLFVVGDDDVWVPKSVIDVDYDDEAWDALKGQGSGEIDIAEWFAKKEGL